MFQVPSSDPSLEYACINSILQRESLLSKISTSFDIELVDIYRETTLDVIETLIAFEEAQLGNEEQVIINILI